MDDAIDRLLACMGPPLCEGPARPCGFPGNLGSELDRLLACRNGFYDAYGALHLFPSERRGGGGTLQWWNASPLWRDGYGALLHGALCFAEDVFGGQFVLRPDGVFFFDPETGNLTALAATLGGWAELVLSDHRRLTGWPAAHSWCERNGPLPNGARLRPAIPFFLGGTADAASLRAIDAVEAMHVLTAIWRQTKDLPDGARVRLIVGEERQGSEELPNLRS